MKVIRSAVVVVILGVSACSTSPNAAPAPTSATAGSPATTITTTTPSSITTTTTSTASTSTSTTVTSTSTVPESACVVAEVPESVGLDAFYDVGCQVDGFWIVANEVVDPVAITKAAAMVSRIFAADSRLAPAFAGADIRLGVIGRDQRTTEMPEYRDLYDVFPDTDWDNRARGLGATWERPLVSAGEENVLCLTDDRYLGEDILLHEFSHVIHEFGYRDLDADFESELVAAYDQAITAGTWAGTYATTNPAEYWAEGVQSYFERNLTSEPADGVHGPIDTRAELRELDPALYDLIDERLGAVTLPDRCG